MASADRNPSPMSWENGVPITAHQGFSRNLSFGQHAPHSAPGCETSLRQPAQTGGNSSRAGSASAFTARFLTCDIDAPWAAPYRSALAVEPIE
jgi:hypothetical protein